MRQLREALLHGRARRIERGFGARVVDAARLQDGLQIGHRLAVLRHRPEIALLHHPAHVLLRLRADPDRMGAAKQKPVGLRVRHDAARRGDHRRLVLRDNAFEADAFMALEGGDAGHFDQQRDARAVLLLDHAVELDERHAELFGQHAAERGFTRAAQADQRNPPGAVGRGGAIDLALDHVGNRDKSLGEARPSRSMMRA